MAKFPTAKALLDDERDMIMRAAAARGRARAEAPTAIPPAAVRIADLVHVAVEGLAEIDPSANPFTARAALEQWRHCQSGIVAAEAELERLLDLAGAPVNGGAR